MIHFFEKGQGQPIVLIHGFCEISELWRDFADALSSDFRVICPDLPGFGKSPIPSDQTSLEEIAVQLEGWMGENQISNPIVIGHSLGGYVTLALLELMGNRLKAVGLFHSTAFPDDQEKKEMRDRTVIFLMKNGVDKFVTTFVPQLFLETRRNELQPQINIAVEQARESTVEGLIAFTTAMRDRKDRLEILKQFSGPKFLIAGIHDGAVKIKASRAQKDAVTDYFELEETGHMGMIERKNETLEIVRNFCTKATNPES